MEFRSLCQFSFVLLGLYLCTLVGGQQRQSWDRTRNQMSAPVKVAKQNFTAMSGNEKISVGIQVKRKTEVKEPSNNTGKQSIHREQNSWTGPSRSLNPQPANRPRNINFESSPNRFRNAMHSTDIPHGSAGKSIPSQRRTVNGNAHESWKDFHPRTKVNTHRQMPNRPAQQGPSMVSVSSPNRMQPVSFHSSSKSSPRHAFPVEATRHAPSKQDSVHTVSFKNYPQQNVFPTSKEMRKPPIPQTSPSGKPSRTTEGVFTESVKRNTGNKVVLPDNSVGPIPPPYQQDAPTNQGAVPKDTGRHSARNDPRQLDTFVDNTMQTSPPLQEAFPDKTVRDAPKSHQFIPQKTGSKMPVKNTPNQQDVYVENTERSRPNQEGVLPKSAIGNVPNITFLNPGNAARKFSTRTVPRPLDTFVENSMRTSTPHQDVFPENSARSSPHNQDSIAKHATSKNFAGNTPDVFSESTVSNRHNQQDVTPEITAKTHSQRNDPPQRDAFSESTSRNWPHQQGARKTHQQNVFPTDSAPYQQTAFAEHAMSNTQKQDSPSRHSMRNPPHKQERPPQKPMGNIPRNQDTPIMNERMNMPPNRNPPPRGHLGKSNKNRDVFHENPVSFREKQAHTSKQRRMHNTGRQNKEPPKSTAPHNQGNSQWGHMKGNPRQQRNQMRNKSGQRRAQHPQQRQQRRRPPARQQNIPLSPAQLTPRRFVWYTAFPNGGQAEENAEMLRGLRLILINSENIPYTEDYYNSATVMDFGRRKMAIRVDLPGTKVCFLTRTHVTFNDAVKELRRRAKSQIPLELGEVMHRIASANNRLNQTSLQRKAGSFIVKFCKDAIRYNNVFELTPEATADVGPQTIAITGLIKKLEHRFSIPLSVSVDASIDLGGTGGATTVSPFGFMTTPGLFNTRAQNMGLPFFGWGLK